MQRPMFKMGGKAASQGTGITSGLDNKVDPRLNLAESVDYSGMDLKQLLNLQQQNQNKQMSGLSDMRDIIKLNAIGQLVGNVLPNVERGGFKGITDFFKDPATTQAALSGLTGLKKVDLKEKELAGSGLDKYIKGRINLKQLDISEKRALQETATALKNRLAEEARKLVATYGPVSEMPPEIQAKYYYNRKIATGDMTPQEAIVLATRLVQADSEKYGERMGTKGFKPEEFKQKVDELAAIFSDTLNSAIVKVRAELKSLRSSLRAARGGDAMSRIHIADAVERVNDILDPTEYIQNISKKASN
jgi:hypothetical protein